MNMDGFWRKFVVSNIRTTSAKNKASFGLSSTFNSQTQTLPSSSFSNVTVILRQKKMSERERERERAAWR